MAAELDTNGPSPLIAPLIARNITSSNELLAPLGPNRIEAHNRNGSGQVSIVGLRSAKKCSLLNTRIETAVSATAITPASTYRYAGPFRIALNPSVVHVSMKGTIESVATTLERNRIRQLSQ